MLIRPLIDHLSRGWIPMAGLLLSSLIWATPLILDQFAWIADLYIHYRAIALTCHPHPRIFKQHSTMLKPVHTQQLAQAPCELLPKGVYSRLLDDEHGNTCTNAADELPLPDRRPSPCRLCAPA